MWHAASTSVERGRPRRGGRGPSSFVHTANNRVPGLERTGGAVGQLIPAHCAGASPPAVLATTSPGTLFISGLAGSSLLGFLAVASRAALCCPAYMPHCGGFSCCRGRSPDGGLSGCGAWV